MKAFFDSLISGVVGIKNWIVGHPTTTVGLVVIVLVLFMLKGMLG